MPDLKLKEAALSILYFPFYVLGWLIKKCWRVVAGFLAASLAGFTEG